MAHNKPPLGMQGGKTGWLNEAGVECALVGGYALQKIENRKR
jgi:hypothetical protein